MLTTRAAWRARPVILEDNAREQTRMWRPIDYRSINCDLLPSRFKFIESAKHISNWWNTALQLQKQDNYTSSETATCSQLLRLNDVAGLLVNKRWDAVYDKLRLDMAHIGKVPPIVIYGICVAIYYRDTPGLIRPLWSHFWEPRVNARLQRVWLVTLSSSRTIVWDNHEKHGNIYWYSRFSVLRGEPQTIIWSPPTFLCRVYTA